MIGVGIPRLMTLIGLSVHRFNPKWLCYSWEVSAARCAIRNGHGRDILELSWGWGSDDRDRWPGGLTWSGE